MAKLTDNGKHYRAALLPQNKSHTAKIIVGASLFLIIYFTLFPFDFFFKETSSLLEILQNFDWNLTESYTLKDVPRNIILFAPLGFGLAGQFMTRKVHRLWAYTLTLLIGIGLSLTVEVLQTYALLRFPSVGDVLANGIGTAVGILIYQTFGNKILSRLVKVINLISSFFTIKRAIIAYLLYVSLWLFISYLMQNGARLSNWDDQYPLILGNERTQDRPWQGVIKDLHFSDRALTDEEVVRLFINASENNQDRGSIVAFYDFTGDDSKNFPMLDWKSTGSIETSKEGVLISKNQWLQSDQPVTQLSQALASSSQFTVGITAASKDLTQKGPARLVSISEDPFLRNLTIGQQEKSLVFRLRTPLTGIDGSHPELIIPGVFIDQTFHKIVITYDGAVVRLYIDNPANIFVIELVPSVAIFTTFFPNNVEQMRINQGNMFIFRFLFSALIFLPMSFLIFPWRKTQIAMGKNKNVRFGVGLIFPAVLWEFLLGTVITGYDLRVGNILLNVVITAVTVFLLTLQSKTNEAL